jgi:hypothetical protein
MPILKKTLCAEGADPLWTEDKRGLQREGLYNFDDLLQSKPMTARKRPRLRRKRRRGR